MLEDFVQEVGSTTPCYQSIGDTGLLLYRYGSSSWSDRVAVRTQRYDTSGATPVLLEQRDIATGNTQSEYGSIGIEQLWTRYDPRMHATAATWQWWQIPQRQFGSNPFVYTDDAGVTWRLADGSVLQTPVSYAQRTPTLVPFDHIAMGVTAEWNPRDIGWGPDGTPWITLPDGNGNAVFWRWDGAAWDGHTFAGPVMTGTKPYACGATRDYLAIAYVELAAPGSLMVITSRDGGRTWSDPVLADKPTSPGDRISWVVFVQPSDRYLDNAARFIYGHYRGSEYAMWYENSVRLVRVQVGPRADFNADTVADARDVIAFLTAWAAGDWTADFNDNGTVDTSDVLAFLNAFADEF